MTVLYGGFWQRLVALSIDMIILYIFTIILFLIGNSYRPISLRFHVSDRYLLRHFIIRHIFSLVMAWPF